VSGSDGGEPRPSSHPTRPPSISTAPPTRARADVSLRAVPTRVESPDAGHTLDVRAAFVWLHADGREDLASIGELTSLPLEEVLHVFSGLMRDGLVTLAMPADGRDDAAHAPREAHTTSPPPLE